MKKIGTPLLGLAKYIYNIEGKITECWLVETEGIFS